MENRDCSRLDGRGADGQVVDCRSVKSKQRKCGRSEYVPFLAGSITRRDWSDWRPVIGGPRTAGRSSAVAAIGIAAVTGRR